MLSRFDGTSHQDPARRLHPSCGEARQTQSLSAASLLESLQFHACSPMITNIQSRVVSSIRMRCTQRKADASDRSSNSQAPRYSIILTISGIDELVRTPKSIVSSSNFDFEWNPAECMAEKKASFWDATGYFSVGAPFGTYLASLSEFFRKFPHHPLCMLCHKRSSLNPRYSTTDLASRSIHDVPRSDIIIDCRIKPHRQCRCSCRLDGTRISY